MLNNVGMQRPDFPSYWDGCLVVKKEDLVPRMAIAKFAHLRELFAWEGL